MDKYILITYYDDNIWYKVFSDEYSAKEWFLGDLKDFFHPELTYTGNVEDDLQLLSDWIFDECPEVFAYTIEPLNIGDN